MVWYGVVWCGVVWCGGVIVRVLFDNIFVDLFEYILTEWWLNGD